jgi:hypothetical protein
MKRKLLTVACLAGLLSVSIFSVKAEVSQKVLQSFHSVFTQATHVMWTENANSYSVSFNQNDMTLKIAYDKEGNLLNSVRYYKEQRLPLNIMYKVKKAYPSNKIDIVTEVSTPDGTVYFINLKDDKNWTIVKSDESGELEVTEKFARLDK